MRISKFCCGHSIDTDLHRPLEPRVLNPLPVGQPDQSDQPIRGRRLSDLPFPVSRPRVMARRWQDGGYTVLKTRMPLEEITGPSCDFGCTQATIIKRFEAELDEERLTVGRPEIRFQRMPETTVLVLIGCDDLNDTAGGPATEAMVEDGSFKGSSIPP